MLSMTPCASVLIRSIAPDAMAGIFAVITRRKPVSICEPAFISSGSLDEMPFTKPVITSGPFVTAVSTKESIWLPNLL